MEAQHGEPRAGLRGFKRRKAQRNSPLAYLQEINDVGKAAQLGDSNAQVNLALLLLKGEGAKSNPQEAIGWLVKAANQGSPEGQASLGMLYALGQGVSTDLVVAQKWMTLAAEQGNSEALIAIKRLEPKLSEEQKNLATELVKQWKGKSEAEVKKSASKEPKKPSDAKA